MESKFGQLADVSPSYSPSLRGSKMSRLALAADQLISLRQQLLEQRHESCAILLGRSVEVQGRLARIVVRESVIPQKSAYSDRSPVSAQLRPEFVGEIA